MPRYYSEHGGGLNLAPLDGNQCPLYVGEEDSYFDRGIPIKFSDWRYEDGFVSESENLNIEMDTNVTICSKSNYWRITPVVDVVPARLFITAGPKPSNGLFQIKRSDLYKGLYQIFFCPDGSDCTKVGIFVDKNGVRRLALNSTSIEFAFDATGKKTSSNTISTS